MANALIFGINSDIAQVLKEEWLARNWDITATSRRTDISDSEINLYCPLDFTFPEQVHKAIPFISKFGTYDLVVFTSGNMEPIGNFAESDFDLIVKSIQINFSTPLMIIQELIRLNLLRKNCLILVLGGGGTNSAPKYYLPYSVSKLALTKSMEILAEENPMFRFVSLGVGWIKTKIHDQTLSAGKKSGDNLSKTLTRLKNNDFGNPKDISEFIDWLLQQKVELVSGRNFSLQGDPWRDSSRIEPLLLNSENFKLRRNLF